MIGRSDRRAGFTLIEALAALVLATMLFAGMAFYTGGWARQWSEIVGFGSQQDIVAIMLDRMVEEIEAAQPAWTIRDGAARTAFVGDPDSVSFVRPALGFQPRAGLDRVTYAIGAVDSERAVMRFRRTYDPAKQVEAPGEDLPLMRGGVSLAFAYAGPDGSFMTQWSDRSLLPRVVRIEVSGTSPRPWRQVAYARTRVEVPASCATAELLAACLDLTR